MVLVLDLLDAVMPRAHKRKRNGPIDASTGPPVASTVPTLKDYIWKELADVLQANATEPLSGKEFSSMAMKRFR